MQNCWSWIPQKSSRCSSTFFSIPQFLIHTIIIIFIVMLEILCITFCFYEYLQNLTRWAGAMIKLYDNCYHNYKLEGSYSLNMHYILFIILISFYFLLLNVGLCLNLCFKGFYLFIFYFQVFIRSYISCQICNGSLLV